MAGQIARSDSVHSRFYIEAGRLEALNARVEPSLLAESRHAREVLLAKGNEVIYLEFGGGWLVIRRLIEGSISGSMGVLAGRILTVAFLALSRYGDLTQVLHLRKLRLEFGRRLLVAHRDGNHRAAR